MYDRKDLDRMKQQMMSQARPYTYKELQELVDNNNNPLAFYHIPKEDIVSLNFRNIDQLMNNIQMVGKPFRGRLVLTVDGYDDTPKELYEILEVRKFAEILFQKYPHILYYAFKEMDADVWLLNCFADEVTSYKKIEDDMDTYEVFEKYGLDYDSVPKVQSRLTVSNVKLARMLKAIMKHGKLKRDVRGAKKTVIHYVLRFDNPMEILSSMKFSTDEILELMAEMDSDLKNNQ